MKFSAKKLRSLKIENSVDFSSRKLKKSSMARVTCSNKVSLIQAPLRGDRHSKKEQLERVQEEQRDEGSI